LCAPDTWIAFCNEQEITSEVVSEVSFWTPTKRTSEEKKNHEENRLLRSKGRDEFYIYSDTPISQWKLNVWNLSKMKRLSKVAIMLIRAF